MGSCEESNTRPTSAREKSGPTSALCAHTGLAVDDMVLRFILEVYHAFVYFIISVTIFQEN